MREYKEISTFADGDDCPECETMDLAYHKMKTILEGTEQKLALAVNALEKIKASSCSNLSSICWACEAKEALGKIK